MNSIVKNQIKTWTLMSVMFIFVVGIGFLISASTGNRMFLYGFALFSIVGSLVSYWYSDKMVLKMSRAEPMDERKYGYIYEMTRGLVKKAQMPMPKMYIMHEASPNAFATGRNPENAAVAVTAGILELLSRDELEGVIAHELSHIKNRDILISTIATILASIITVAVDYLMMSSLFGGGDDEEEGGGFGFAGMIVISILASLAASIVQMSISRKREFLAYASGAKLVGRSDGLARALEKISGSGIAMQKPNKATAHMYISNPLKSGGIMKLFMTHPPVSERLEELRKIN